MTLTPNEVREALAADATPISETLNVADVLASDSQRVALKTWLQGAERLDTAQLTLNAEGRVLRSWLPGVREVTLKASYMLLDGSRRDFAGMLHVAHSDQTYAALDASMSTLVIYRKA